MARFSTCLILFVCISLLSSQLSFAQWVQTSLGGNIQAFALNDSGVFAGTSSGLFRSANNGTSWTGVISGLMTSTLAINTLAMSGDNLFAGGTGIILMSSNCGTTWSRIDSGYVLSPADRALMVNDSSLFVGQFGGVYCTSNNGASWTKADTGITNKDVRSFAATGSILFTGTWSGVFRSVDNGTTWVSAGLQNICVLALHVSGSNLFAGTRFSGVFFSPDSGATWTAVNTGLPANSFVNCFTTNSTDLYAGTDDGVYLSTNNGATWTNTGFTFGSNTAVKSLIVSGSYLLAGISSQYSGGVWQLPLTPVITGNPHNTFQKDNYSFKFHNPIQSHLNATINLSLSRSDKVCIQAFSLLGHNVTDIVNEQMASGTHSILWDTHKITPGYYLVRMQLGSISPVYKVILLLQ